jgi:hypothetical protein
MQEPKLGLSDVKPVIHLKRVEHLSERQRVHRQEVSVGGVQHWLVASSVHEVLRQHLHKLTCSIRSRAKLPVCVCTICQR